MAPTFKRIHIVMPMKLYLRLKRQYPYHGGISGVVRVLLEQHLAKLEAGQVEPLATEPLSSIEEANAS